jgi:hypothetical protein
LKDPHDYVNINVLVDFDQAMSKSASTMAKSERTTEYKNYENWLENHQVDPIVMKPVNTPS